MYLRLAKIILVGLIGAFALLVAVNNITDYGSNFQFVQHVLSMDTTFEGNRLMWRAMPNPTLHHMAYAIIIVCEMAVGVLCLWGAYRMWLSKALTLDEFHQAKRIPTLGLVLGVVLWFGGFMTVGAEWFLMWQSSQWNGQEAAFRFIVVIFATLIFLHQVEPQH